MLNFVAIDFETGKRSMESAISIGLVKFIDGKKSDTFYSLIRPPVLYIRPDFTKIHGLTVADVEFAPKFPEIWPSIVDFIADLPLVAHNASFDMAVLRAVLCWYELNVVDILYFDSLWVSRKTWPELCSHKLTFLGQSFGIEYDAHNALSDSETCGKIILLAAENWQTNNVKDLLNECNSCLKKF